MNSTKNTQNRDEEHTTVLLESLRNVKGANGSGKSV